MTSPFRLDGAKGRATNQRGRKRALTGEQVERIRSMYAITSCSMQRIADHFGVSQGVIQAVIDKRGPYAIRHLTAAELERVVKGAAENAAADDQPNGPS